MLDYKHPLQPSLHPRWPPPQLSSSVFFLPSSYHACGYLIFLLQGSLREEKITEAGKREEGGRGWEVMEISTLLNAQSIIPYKDIMSSFADMLAGYGSSQHCLHALVYSCTLYIYTHALTSSLIHKHTLHTRYSCTWYFLSSWTCAFSSAVFCRKKNISCLRFSADRRNEGSVGGKSDSRAKYGAGIVHL